MDPIVSFTLSYNAGNNALNSGNNVEAVRLFKIAAAVWDRCEDTSIPSEMMAACMTNLGTAYTRQGLIDDAIRSFDRSLEVNSSFITALYNKAWLLEKVNRTAEAIVTWEAYLKSARTDFREKDLILETEKHLSLCKTERVLQKHGVPKLADDISLNDDKWIVRVPRDVIEHTQDGTQAILASCFGGIAASCVKEGRLHKITLTISGYDSDPRELYEIPEVCTWARDTFKALTSLWFFLDDDSRDRFIGWLCGPFTHKDIQSSDFIQQLNNKRMECAVTSFAAASDFLERNGASKEMISNFYFQAMNKLDSNH